MKAAIKDVIAEVARAAQCSRETVRQPTSHELRPRHVRMLAMSLTHDLTGTSYSDIGRAFGCDHSTVMSACDRMSTLLVQHRDLAEIDRLARAALALKCEPAATVPDDFAAMCAQLDEAEAALATALATAQEAVSAVRQMMREAAMARRAER